MRNEQFFPVVFSPSEYDSHKSNFDGLCQLCGSWKFEGAAPNDRNIYCDQCENRAVMGVKVALEAGLIQVQ